MFEKLEIFQLSSGLAQHAAARQAVIAANVANADTPGYRAKDITAFSAMLGPNAPKAMRQTRQGHFAGPPAQNAIFQTIDTEDPVSPNGNSVSLETEMIRGADVRQQFDVALSVYSTSLNILRTSIGRK